MTEKTPAFDSVHPDYPDIEAEIDRMILRENAHRLLHLKEEV